MGLMTFFTDWIWFIQVNLVWHNIILFSALQNAGAQAGYQMPSLLGRLIHKTQKPDPAMLNRVKKISLLDIPV